MTDFLKGKGRCFRKIKEIEEQWSHKTVLWMETYKR